ncbi:MAG: pitrilysin family protein [Spirochaetota bacterium]
MKDTVFKQELDNSLTLLYQKAPYVASASLGVWVRVGSRFEKDSEMGYTHFLEHMLFKGTENRTAKQLAEEVERVGGYFNAATSREYTYYYVTVASANLELGFRILSDMLFHSLLLQEDVENEAEVILEEMRSYEDSPDDYVYDAYFRNIYAGQKLGRDIIGTRESVGSVTASKLKRFYNKHYRTDRMILAISANLPEKKITALAKKYFSVETPPANPSHYKLRKVKKSFVVNFEKRDLNQVSFLIGAEGYARNFEAIVRKILLTTILGGGMSSRLFQKIREDQGLCYSISCFPSSFSNTGVINISCATSNKRFLYCLDSIMQELKEVKNNGFSQKELDDAKSNQIGSMSIGFESPETRMMNIAMQELYYEQYRDFNQRVKAIQAVTLDDLYETITQVFSVGKLHFTGIGNLTDTAIQKIDTSL